jgi:hypothetical protein
MSENTQEKENEKQSEWRKRECGALWKREGRSQNFLSGYVKVGEFGIEKEVKLVVFTNKYKKENAKAPDFVVYESTDLTPSAEVKTESATAESATAESATAESSDNIPDLLAE